MAGAASVVAFLICALAFPPTRPDTVRILASAYLLTKGLYLEHADVVIGGGDLDVSGLDITEAGRPFFTAAHIDVKYGVAGRAFGISRLIVRRPHLVIRRSADGTYDIARLVGVGSGGGHAGTPFKAFVRVTDGAVDVVNDAAPTAASRTIVIRNADVDASIDQSYRSTGRASLQIGDGANPASVRIAFDENDVARIARATATVRRVQLAPLIDVPVSSSAFVVESGRADVDLDAYAAGWNPDAGPQWHVIGAGDLSGAALRTLPLAEPIVGIGGRFSVFDGTLEFRDLRGAAAGAPIIAAGSVELFPHMQLGLRARAAGPLDHIKTLLAFSSRLPLRGTVGIALAVDGQPSSPHADVVLHDLGGLYYAAMPVDELALHVYYHDGHVALPEVRARYGGALLDGDGDIDMTATPIAGQFVVRVQGRSSQIPWLADLENSGTMRSLIVLDGPLMKLSGAGFAATAGGEQRVRAQVVATPDRLAVASAIAARKGGELIAFGDVDRTASAQSSFDVYAQRYHARSNGRAVKLVGISRSALGLPPASGMLDGYAVLRAAATAPSGAIDLDARAVSIAGRPIGRVTVRGAGTSQAFQLTRLAIAGPAAHLDAHGVGRLATGRDGSVGVVGAIRGDARGDLGAIGAMSDTHGHVAATFSGYVHGTAWVAGVDAHATDRSVAVKGVPVRDVRAVVGSNGSGVAIYGASADVAGGHIDAQGSVPGSRPGSLSIAGRDIDVAHQRALPLPVAGGELDAIGRITGTAKAPVMSAAAAFGQSSYRGFPLAADAQLDYRAGTLALRNARIVGANSVAELNGTIAGLQSADPSVSLDAVLPVADLETLSAMQPSIPALGGMASGHVRAAGSLHAPIMTGDVTVGAGTVRGVGFTDLHAAIEATRGSVSVRDAGVTFGSSRLALAGDMSGSGAALRASSPHVDLDDFNDFFNGKDVLEGHGSLDLAISNYPAQRSASGTFAFSGTAVDGVPLGNVSGNLHRSASDLTFSLSQRSAVATSRFDVGVPPQLEATPSFTMHGDVQRLDLAALAPFVGLEDAAPRGIAHAGVRASGTLGDLRGTLAFGVNNGSLRGVAVREASGSLSVARRSIAARDLRVAIDGASATLNGTIDEHRRIRARADVDIADLHQLSLVAMHPIPLSGSATATIDAEGPLGAPRVDMTLAAAHGQIRHVGFDAVTATAAFDRGAVTARGAVGFSRGRGTLVFSGTVPIQTRPFRIGPNDRPLAFVARLNGVGLGAFDPLLRGAATITGIANGDMRVYGDAGRPRLDGALQLRSASVTSKFDTVPLTQLSADVAFSSDAIDIQRLHGTVGSGTLDARGSAHIVPATEIRRNPSLQYAFGARLHGANVDVPDVVTATVDAQLGLTKPGTMPFVYGGVQFSHTSVPFTTLMALASRHASPASSGNNIPGVPPLRPHHIVVYGGSAFGDDLDHVLLPTPAPTPPPAIAVVPRSVGLDLRVVAGDDVGVSGLINVTGTGVVNVAGTSAAPSLDGALTAVRGRAGFLNTDFELLDGRVMFRPTQGFLPDISADALAHTEDADITLSTYGRVDQLHTDLSSDPPMNNSAIIATLLRVPQINSALASSHGQEQSALGVAPQNLVAGAIAGQILGALNIGLEQVFNLEEVDFGLDMFGRPILEVRKQISPRAYTLYRTTFSVPPAQALGLAYQVRRALQIEFTQSQTTPGVLGTYALPQTSLTVKMTFH